MPDVTPNSLARRIMERYDRNGDGKITLEGKTIPEAGQTLSETHVFQAKQTDTYSQTGHVICQQTTMVSLFKDADANKDGQVTLPELKNAISTFDRNKNGIIGKGEKIKGSTAKELDLLKSSYPEEAMSTTVQVKKGQAAPTDKKDLSKSVYGESLTFSGHEEELKQQQAQLQQQKAADRLKQLKAQYRSLGFAISDLLDRTGPAPGGMWGIEKKAARRKAQPTIDAMKAQQAAIAAEMDALNRQRIGQ